MLTNRIRLDRDREASHDFCQAYFILVLLTSPELSHATVAKVLGFIASLVVTLLGGAGGTRSVLIFENDYCCDDEVSSLGHGNTKSDRPGRFR
ncbi:MAG: hypothetical protein ACYDHM_12305 [Acidiferrobacterales bacterium]